MSTRLRSRRLAPAGSRWPWRRIAKGANCCQRRGIESGFLALWSAGIAGALLVSGCKGPESDTKPEDGDSPVAELILRGGNVITLDDDFGNVSALAVAEGKILAVGTDADVAGFRDASTKIIELEGRTVVPGFIEGHGHFTGIGQASQVLDLRAVESWEGIVSMVESAVAEAAPGEWILGRGWHQEKWKKVPAGGVE